MKRFICAVLTLTMLLGLMLPCAHAAGEEEFHGYLVGLPELRLMSVQDVDADVTRLTDDVCLVDSLADVRAMQKAGLVEYYEPNYPMYLMDTQWNMSIVNAPSAWNHMNSDEEYDRRGTGVTIAVIDSGVSADNTDFIPEHILPYFDYYNNENGVDIWHGTFVTGLIAAQVDNGIGIDGAAPDVNILPITITKGGKSDTAVAIQALDYAVKQGADIINLSIGGSKSTRSLERACQEVVDAGVIIVAAAGNYEKDATDFSEKNIIYPAGYDCVVGVSGVKATVDGPVFDDTYSYFNNKVNVCAPGTNIKSLYFALGTASASGTSFAAPIVSSMAAIAKQVNPAITQDTFTALVQDTATDLGDPGYDVYYGHGLVNMEAFCEALDEEYPIRYVSGGQDAEFEEDVPRTYTIADPDVTLPIPVRDGYRFVGWYNNPGLLGNAVTKIPTASMGVKTFYAKWQQIPNTAPAIRADAPRQASVTPASLDGVTAAIPFSADISSWFEDAEGDAITIELTEGPAELTGNSLTYIPAAQDAGKNVLLRFRASDSKGAVSDIHTVTVRVGAVPNSVPAIAENAPTAAEASPLSADGKTAAVPFRADVSEWFTDADQEALNYYLIEGPATLDNSLLEFTPVPQEAGQEITLRVQAEDGSGARSPVHTITIYVSTTPNSAPVVTASGPAEVYCTPASLDRKTAAQSFSADLSEWFSDPDDDELTYRLLEGPGTLSGAAYTYTPAANEGGCDYQLRLQATDKKGAVSPVLSVTVHVGIVPNSAPTVEASAPAQGQATPPSLDGKTAAVPYTADVSEWFRDLDGDSLTYRVTGAALDGTTLSCTPTLQDVGRTIELTVEAADGSGLTASHTIRVAVGAVPNSAPAISANAPVEVSCTPASLDGNTAAVPYTADVSEWFSDPDGDELIYALLDGPGVLSGTVCTCTPAVNEGGRDYQLRLQATDKKGAVSPVLSVTVHVGIVPNSAPTVEASAPAQGQAAPPSLDGRTAAVPYTADVSEWFRDLDGDSLTYRVTGAALDGTTLSCTPAVQDAGKTIVLTVEAADNSGSTVSHTVRVAVGAVPNSAPAISGTVPAEVFCTPASLDGKTTAVPYAADVSEWFSDPDGDSLTYALLEGPGTLEGAAYSFTPPAADSAKDLTLRLQAKDAQGAQSPVLTLIIHVADLTNSAPTLSGSAPALVELSPASLDGLTSGDVFTADIGGWFTDADGEALSYRLLEGPAKLEGSTLTFVPDAGLAGSNVTVRLQAVDPRNALSPVLSLTFRVGAVPSSQSTLEDAGDISLDLCRLSEEVCYTVRLYDNTVTGVTLNGEDAVWTMEGETLYITLPAGLSEGEAEVCIRFDRCEPVTARLNVFRDCPSAPFTDIDINMWYHSSVDFAVRRGLMQGVSADRFAPNDTFTRAMMVTVLYRLAGQPEVTAECPFDDVPEGMWYTVPVAWAAENGIVNGTGPGKFDPNSPVTREQLVTILFRYAGDDGVRAELDAFPDARDVSGFAVGPVGWAIGHGIISGVSTGGNVTISPLASATRTQVAAILMRFIGE